MKIPESMKFVFKTLTIWGFVCLLIISTVGIPLADTDTRNRDTLYSASDCPSPPPGFRDTDKGYAQLSWTVNPRYQDHQLHCVYEDPTHAGKARAELHTYEAPEDGVKNIFNKGNAGKELKDMCQNVVIGLYGGWGEFLDNEADRFVVACGRPEIPPDKEYLEIIGRIRYNRSIIKIFVSGYGNAEMVVYAFDVLEKDLKTLADKMDSVISAPHEDDLVVIPASPKITVGETIVFDLQIDSGDGETQDYDGSIEWAVTGQVSIGKGIDANREGQEIGKIDPNNGRFTGLNPGKALVVANIGRPPNPQTEVEVVCPKGIKGDMEENLNMIRRLYEIDIPRGPILDDIEAAANLYKLVDQRLWAGLNLNRVYFKRADDRVKALITERLEMRWTAKKRELEQGKRANWKKQVEEIEGLLKNIPEEDLQKEIDRLMVIGFMHSIGYHPGHINNTLANLGMEPRFSKRYLPNNCGGCQVKVLDFLERLKASGERCTLLNGYLWGPIEASNGGHHIVVIWEEGHHWTEGEAWVFDPWPTQTPEFYTMAEYKTLFSNIRGERNPDVRGLYPTTTFPEPISGTDDLPPHDLSGGLMCHVDLLFTDSNGRRMGVLDDGSMVYEIPNSYIQRSADDNGEDAWFFGLDLDAADTFRLDIVGTDKGTFEILTDNAEDRSIQYYGENPIATGEKATITFGKANSAPPLILPNGKKVTPSVFKLETGSSGLTFESRSKPSGSSVQIPITVKGVEEPIGNMDLILGYSSSILEPIEIVKGSLTSESLFDYNIVGESILISLADNAGITSDGSIAYILCNVVGNEGSSCSLVIEEIAANSANDYEPLSLLTRDGIFLVTDSQESIGDCNGDGKLTAVDALCALQMAVGKRTEDLSLDMNSDGKVSSLDARTILKIAVGGI